MEPDKGESVYGCRWGKVEFRPTARIEWVAWGDPPTHLSRPQANRLRR
jgi:hypothetical protein